MTRATFYYVCDTCGDLVTIENHRIPSGEEWTCEKCGGHALWEFERALSAMEHAERLQHAYRERERAGMLRRTDG